MRCAFDSNVRIYPQNQLRRANSYCGTIEYMAPEVVQRTDAGYTEVSSKSAFGTYLTFRRSTGGRWVCCASSCSPAAVRSLLKARKNSSKEIAECVECFPA